MQGSKNAHEPNAFCNRERRKQLAQDFLRKHLKYEEPVKIINVRKSTRGEVAWVEFTSEKIVNLLWQRYTAIGIDNARLMIYSPAEYWDRLQELQG